MTRFESIKSKNIDEFVDWIDKHFALDSAPYMYWFDKKYCNHCQPEEVYDVDRDSYDDYGYCEVCGKCRFFKDSNEVPTTKQIIKMWLETEE